MISLTTIVLSNSNFNAQVRPISWQLPKYPDMSSKNQLVREQMAHQIIRIQPNKGFSALGLGELWEYRDLLWFNILKNIKSKYRQMALRSIVDNFAAHHQYGHLYFVFGNMAGLDSGGIPYPLLTLSALIPWNFFKTPLLFLRTRWLRKCQ